jgi:alpha,alpha-trehalase
VERFAAIVLDLDGVVTRTASVHAKAWKRMFDDFLKERAEREGIEFTPFDAAADYKRYVDGMPRYDGVRTFLASRDIDLPEGTPDDPPDAETVCGLGNRKNNYFNAEIQENGVEVFDSTVEVIERLRAAGLKTAIVSSSKNCGPILEAAGLSDLFDTKVDGIDAAEHDLPGKPAPDTYVEACHRLCCTPGRAVMVEDAIAGVESGRNGDFGLVIGVDRDGDGSGLLAHGADVAVSDMAEVDLILPDRPLPRTIDRLPPALLEPERIDDLLHGKRPAIFLDYDGTLTPIVAHPEDAVIDEAMRKAVRHLSVLCPVAVISGRDLGDLKDKVRVDGIGYAGSHGFDILDSEGRPLEGIDADRFFPALDRVQHRIEAEVAEIEGAQVERKKYSCAIHYRNVAEDAVPRVDRAVDDALADESELRRFDGKKVIEVQPDIDWHKGKAVDALIDALGLDVDSLVPIFVGDDTTDEDAFRSLSGRGLGVVVGDDDRETAADLVVRDTDGVRALLELLSDLAGGAR